jgi:hypothetical protein
MTGPSHATDRVPDSVASCSENSKDRRWVVLAVLCLSVFVVVDSTKAL